MSGQVVVRSPRGLYRCLLRRLASLPEDAHQYYKHRIRQEYSTHSDEDNPDRIEQIMQRAVVDVDWIAKKYEKK